MIDNVQLISHLTPVPLLRSSVLFIFPLAAASPHQSPLLVLV